MKRDIAYHEAFLSLSQKTSPDVITLLFCQNTLIRSGIGNLLSGTHFLLTEQEPEQSAELPVLWLLYMNQVSDDVTEAVQSLRVQWPSARVVLVADYMEPAVLRQAFQAGLDGLCSPAMDRNIMIKALELVMLGETFIPAAAGLALCQQSQAPVRVHASRPMAPASGNAFASVFSVREAQVLRLLTTGASNKEISRDLGLPETTVKVHVKAILRKVKASNRTQAALWAQQHISQLANEAIIAQ